MFLANIFNFKGRSSVQSFEQNQIENVKKINSTQANSGRTLSVSSSASSSQASSSSHQKNLPISILLGEEDLDKSLKIFGKKEWIQVVKTKKRESTSYNEIKASLRKGIPKSIRPRIWFWLADIKKLQSMYEKGIYQRLSSYVNIQWDSEIKKDIHRTTIDYSFFQGQDSIGQKQLYKILNAFCNIDVSDTGYAQGMNVIVATILLTLHEKRNFKNPKLSFGKTEVSNDDLEEWAFWLLVYIMQEKNQHKIYQKNMVMRKQLLDSLYNRLQKETPRFIEHMNSHQIDIGLAFDQDFFSIMSYKCPLQLSQFVMDMFLFDGHSAIIDIISRIILINEEELLAQGDFDKLMYFLKQKKNEISWKKCKKSTYYLVPFEFLQYNNGRTD